MSVKYSRKNVDQLAKLVSPMCKTRRKRYRYFLQTWIGHRTVTIGAKIFYDFGMFDILIYLCFHSAYNCNHAAHLFMLMHSTFCVVFPNSFAAPICACHGQIHPHDESPTSICSECYTFVGKLERFAVRCVKVDKMFAELIFDKSNMFDSEIDSVRCKYGLDEEDVSGWELRKTHNAVSPKYSFIFILCSTNAEVSHWSNATADRHLDTQSINGHTWFIAAEYR